MTQATIIPGLSQNPPARSDPSTFDSRGASLLGDLPNLVGKFNTVVSELNAWNASTEVDKTSTGASRTTAIASEQAAKASALTSAQRSAVWTSGVNYSVGYLVESPITARQYRCIQSGVSTVDPSLDTTRWEVLGFEFNTQYPNIKPSLNLNFAKTKILDPRITFTRNSIATYFDQYGVMKTAQANQARFDHDPVTGESLGLLIEESRTNLINYSSDFVNASWLKDSVNITGDSIVAPDGTLTADKVVLNNSATRGQVYVGNTDTSQKTVSCFVKKAEWAFVGIGFNNGGGVWSIAVFSLANGTFSNVTNYSTPQISDYSIEAFGNGWYRISATVTGANSHVAIMPAAAAGDIVNPAWVGDGVSGVYIWGAQLEQGSFSTSYIPTTSTSVTRQADVAVMQGLNFSSWYRTEEGTICAKIQRTSSPNNTNEYAGLEFSDGTFQRTLINFSYDYASFNQPCVSIVNATTEVSVRGGNSQNFTQGEAPYNFVFGYKSQNCMLSVNGSSATVNTALAVMPSVNYVRIASTNSSVYPPSSGFNGYFRELNYYPKCVSTLELQALSRP